MLAKSGLLEITMKTADLLRSNQQAQRELEQLKVGQLILAARSNNVLTFKKKSRIRVTLGPLVPV